MKAISSSIRYPLPGTCYIVPKSIREHGAELEPLIYALRKNVGDET